jgi:hypothetical protein
LIPKLLNLHQAYTREVQLDSSTTARTDCTLSLGEARELWDLALDGAAVPRAEQKVLHKFMKDLSKQKASYKIVDNESDDDVDGEESSEAGVERVVSVTSKPCVVLPGLATRNRCYQF